MRSVTDQISDDIKCYKVEPRQRVNLGVIEAALAGCTRDTIPLAHQILEIGMNVLLELANTLRGECVGDHLAFSAMFGAIPRIEEASLDVDKGIVVLASLVVSGSFQSSAHSIAGPGTYAFMKPFP
jgi:hypothetical protein